MGYSSHDLMIIAGLAKVDVRTVQRWTKACPKVRPATRAAIERAAQQLRAIAEAQQ